MYASEVDGQILNFAVSGKLWKRSLVMVDEETQTLWSHLLGRAMEGKLAGTQLQAIPSVLTDWKSWRDEHPDTTVLKMSRTSREFRRSFYRNPSQFVLGLSRHGKAKAWSFAQLKSTPLVNDTFEETPIVIYFEAESAAGYIYERVVDGSPITFAREGDRIIDVQTKSTWNLARGVSIEGERKGTKLQALVGIPSFAKSWQAFYPKSAYWQPSR